MPISPPLHILLQFCSTDLFIMVIGHDPLNIFMVRDFCLGFVFRVGDKVFGLGSGNWLTFDPVPFLYIAAFLRSNATVTKPNPGMKIGNYEVFMLINEIVLPFALCIRGPGSE